MGGVPAWQRVHAELEVPHVSFTEISLRKEDAEVIASALNISLRELQEVVEDGVDWSLGATEAHTIAKTGKACTAVVYDDYDNQNFVWACHGEHVAFAAIDCHGSYIVTCNDDGDPAPREVELLKHYILIQRRATEIIEAVD